MVSPSKSKLSKTASQQQQQQQEQPTPQSSHRKSTNSSTTNKVKLVKGPKPLIYHRFYLDIERHQVATKIETTIKELGGSIEFFLNKDITHFITDKHHHQAGGSLPITTPAAAGTGEEHQPSPSAVGSLARRFGPASPAATTSPDTPILGTRNRHKLQQQPVLARHHSLHPTHQQTPYGQHVNDYGPATSRTSSPCPTPTITAATATASSSSAVCTSGAARSVQQTVATGEVATFSSTAPVSPVTAGLDGKGKSTQPANTSATAQVLPRNRADAMLQRVRQQHHQQQQYQTTTPHHLLHSSPLNPPVYVHGTPTKSETPLGTPPSFHSSSHHKLPNPASPCYSPAGAGTTAPVGPSRQPKPTRQNSPVQLARSWGTPVWSAEQALKFLRKVLDSVQNENRNRSTSLALLNILL